MTSQAAIPVAEGGDQSTWQFQHTMDAIEQLKMVLREEHSLLMQYKMIIWGRVFTPIRVRRQKAHKQREKSRVSQVRELLFKGDVDFTFLQKQLSIISRRV